MRTSLMSCLMVLCAAVAGYPGMAQAETLSQPGWVAYRPDVTLDSSDYAAKFKGSGWYVDSVSGDDSASGTVNRPWKTLARAAIAPMGSGDALLLRCGSVWRETLTLSPRYVSGSSLLIGAYGDCKKGRRPVIRGGVLLPQKGWRKLDDVPGAFVLETRAPIKQLHVNGQPVLKARYPHYMGVGKEFVLGDGLGRDKLRVRATELNQLKARDVVGAAIYVRVVAWQVEQAKVTDFDVSTGIVTLDHPLSTAILPSTGYFLEGKRWMLGAANEWFHDAVSGQLFITPAEGVTLGSAAIEASTLERGIEISGVTGLTIERLAVENAAYIGVALTGTERPTINDVQVLDAFEYGIYIQDAAQATVKNAKVAGAGWTGIYVRNSAGLVVQGNRVTDTGLRGRSGGSRAAITVDGVDALVSDNVVERSANLGIHFFNRAGTRVLSNTVVTSCLRMTDCAGIYTWTSSDVSVAASKYQPMALVERNIVLGGLSNLDGTPLRGKNQACGIYLDELSSGISISSNVVVGSELGICLHNARFNVVKGNTVGAVRHASFSAHQSRDDADLLKGNKVTSNRLVSKDNEVSPLIWSYPKSIGRVLKGEQGNDDDGNRVVKLAGEASFYKLDAGATTGRDSVLPTGAFVPYFNPLGTGGRVANPEGCSRPVCVSFMAGHSSDLVSTPNFVLDAQAGKKRYLLSYVAKAGKGGGFVKAVVRRAGPPYESLGVDQDPIELRPGQVQKSELIFDATDSATARVDFYAQVQRDVEIRDVTLRRLNDVRASTESRRAAVQLVNLSDSSRAYSCAESGLATCAGLDDNGQAIKWPLTVGPRATVLVLLPDPKGRP